MPNDGGSTSRTSRSTAPPRPTRSRTWCCSWPPTAPAGSAARWCRWTAAFSIGRAGFSRGAPSVPIPKFASPLRHPPMRTSESKGHQQSMILVRFLDLKFLYKRAAIMIGTSNPPHQRRGSFGRRAAAARTGPAIGERVVGLLGVDPVFAAGIFDLLPEWRAGLEKIHQELGGGEGLLPVCGGGDDEHDAFARLESSVAVHDSDAEQRPALFGCLDVARDFGLGHSGIVLERHGREWRARLIASADAGEGHDGPDI